MAISLQDIADKAGVTRATVSMALRGSTRISENRRRQVTRLAEKMSYRPNVLAKGLTGGRTRAVGVLWSLGGPHLAVEMARNIAIRVQRRDYVTYIADSLADSDTINSVLNDYLLRRVDAVVLQHGSSRMLSEELQDRLAKFPAAAVVTSNSQSLRIDQIVQDRLASFRTVAQHFVRTGRQRPAIVSSYPNTGKAIAYVEQLHALGIKEAENINVKLSKLRPTLETILACHNDTLGNLFSNGKIPFDALMFMQDEAAIAAIACLRKCGLRVPDDVAIVGFNNNPFSKYIEPSLASVERRNGEVADAIERMIFARLNNPASEFQYEEIPMCFVWRESAG